MTSSILGRQFTRPSSFSFRSAVAIKSPIRAYWLSILNHKNEECTANMTEASSSVFTARYASSSSSATGGDLGNPQSTSSDQQDVKSSRATDGNSSPDTASVQTPVSDRSSIPGDQDEGTASHDQVKRDPKEPAGEKRKRVESQGEKPLGPEDHQ